MAASGRNVFPACGRRLARAAALALIVPAIGWAQTAPQPADPAWRRLEVAREAIAAGRTREGLDALQQIAGATSAFADDALFEMGRVADEVEMDPARAADLYEQVVRRFPQSDSAPLACLRLGQLALRGGVPASSIDDAIAQFQRVIRLYPDSPYVSEARAAIATAFRSAGRYDQAVDAASRVVYESPGGAGSAAAHFELALSLALAGESQAALEEFQRLRNAHPDSPAAARALDAQTALYRLGGEGRPVWTRDPAFSLGSGDALRDVRALALTEEGTLWIASNRTRSAISVDAKLQPGPSLAADDPQTLSVSPSGEVLFAARLSVRAPGGSASMFSAPGDKPGSMDAIDRIGAAARLRSGDVLVSDLRRKRVARFRGGAFVSFFPDRTEREVTRLVATPRGEAVMLRRDDRSVEVRGDDGRLLLRLTSKGPAYEWRRPVDIAVDLFANLYVADEELGVFVFSPRGDLLASFGATDARRIRAMAVESSGAVIVYDDRTETLMRFR